MAESARRRPPEVFGKSIAGLGAVGYRARPFTRNHNKTQNKTMSEEATAPQQAAQVQVDTAGMTTGYANVVGLAANINEVYLTFGVNSDPYNPAPTEPVKLSSRVIMTPDAAKRLCLNLNATLAAYEQRFGVIELDLQKRIRS
jgi:hypothetical protein